MQSRVMFPSPPCHVSCYTEPETISDGTLSFPSRCRNLPITPIKVGHDHQLACKEPRQSNGSTLTLFRKIIFSVETGMLTSLCAIASFISVGYHFVPHMTFQFLPNTDHSLASHLHLHKLLFPTGQTYVRMGQLSGWGVLI